MRMEKGNSATSENKDDRSFLCTPGVVDNDKWLKGDVYLAGETVK